MDLTPDEVVADTFSATQIVKGQPYLDSLVGADDPDWVKFQEDDPEWYLRVAGRAIRQYVGWHLFPNIQVTVEHIRTGSNGIIMLPSRHVTQVDWLTIQTGADPVLIPAVDYEVYEAGWIQRKGWAYWNDWYYSGYYYGNDPYYLPVTQPGIAAACLWHGYNELPDDVKQVAFELAEQAMTVRSGNVKQLDAPGGYKVITTQAFGLTLNKDQMDRLASYRIGQVA